MLEKKNEFHRLLTLAGLIFLHLFTGKEKYVHEGIESGILLEGELELELEERSYRMKPGDSITFRSNISHRLNNKGKKFAKGIWVNSKPWIFAIK